MTQFGVSVTIDDHDATLTHSCASALFGLALSQAGGSLDDLERGEIALGELLDALHAKTHITEISLAKVRAGFELAVTLATDVALTDLDQGALQLVDGGFDHWTLHDRTATISLVASEIIGKHE